jgi:hypothetical protein
MRKFVFWTGAYNIVLGSGFLIPGFAGLLGLQLPEANVWLWLPAVLVIYLGLLLVLCSRNLETLGTLVYWEGVLRVVVGLMLGWFGFWTDLGIIAGLIGIVDLLIGLGYLTGLPRELNRPPSSLLLDRVA